MPNLTIKGLPDERHARLKERAERHRPSMNSEAIMILERALNLPPARRRGNDPTRRGPQ